METDITRATPGWIGSCIAEVFTEATKDAAKGSIAPMDDEMPVGITFSFPMA